MVAPVVAAAGISALGSVAGSLMGGAASKSSAKSQMKFQKKVLQHQHQWEVDDLRSAGLNPILSAKYGGTGSAPGAAWGLPDMNLGEALASGVGAYAESKKAEVSEADKDLRRAQFALADAQAGQASTASALQAAQTEKTRIETSRARTEAQTAEEDLRTARFNNRVLAASTARDVAAARTETGIEESKYGQLLRWINRVNPFSSSAGSLTRALTK